LLDAPQWPSESSQGNHLLFFRFAQDVAHIDEGYMPHAEINVPGRILVGRFSGDHHWPVLGDRWGRSSRFTFSEEALFQLCLLNSPQQISDSDDYDLLCLGEPDS
jgi:hypothetical protein